MSKSKTTNLLLEVTSLCMSVAKKYVEAYSHRNSPQKFTQTQLLTLLVLRAYLKTTYRGVIEFVEVSEELRKRIGLTSLPHYSTLKKFADRSSVLEIVDAMLLELVQRFAADEKEAAIDSTGFETTSASAHFQTKTGRKRSKFVKVSVCVMATSLIPSSVVLGWGPSNDKQEAPELLAKATNVNQPERLYGDAGYDADWVHQFCRETWNVESVIKPAVHRSDGGLNGVYRPQMVEEYLKEKSYGRRWVVESFMSGLKRTTGAALSARSERSLFIEAALRVLAYAFRR